MHCSLMFKILNDVIIFFEINILKINDLKIYKYTYIKGISKYN